MCTEIEEWYNTSASEDKGETETIKRWRYSIPYLQSILLWISTL